MPDNQSIGSTIDLSDLDQDASQEFVGIDESEAIELPSGTKLQSSLTDEMARLYALKAAEMKQKIDGLGAEVSQRHERMRAINELIACVNAATDEQNCLDITNNPEIQEKIAAVIGLGVKIPEGQHKFSAVQRDRLIENLHLTADSWDKENKSQTQKIEIFMKELDRYMMVLKEICKDEKQIKQGMTRGMAGG